MPDYRIYIDNCEELAWDDHVETWEADSARGAAEEFLDDQGGEYADGQVISLVVAREDGSEPPVQVGASLRAWSIDNVEPAHESTFVDGPHGPKDGAP